MMREGRVRHMVDHRFEGVGTFESEAIVGFTGGNLVI